MSGCKPDLRLPNEIVNLHQPDRPLPQSLDRKGEVPLTAAG